MKTLRPNSRDITRNLARNHREARPIAQLIALTQHYGAPTVRIHTAHAHDAQLISYGVSTLMARMCYTACRSKSAPAPLTRPGA